MLYDDTHRQQCTSRGLPTPEDNIYEEVDLHQINQTDEDFGDTLVLLAKKKKSSKKGKENEGITGGFTRWFSTRKKEYELEKCVNKINRHSQVLYADEDGYVDVKIPKKQRPPLSLPPMPSGLSPEKMKRRYIIGSIVDSENSYVNSLQRLIRLITHSTWKPRKVSEFDPDCCQ
ncbi:rho guanine nucleotide exchange factor 10 [Caerostris extrusa]|uniref:Rho guanine nucleotide exchange factor 10 n=1 Tax=Caerostris extrusa TaxID=172846 RepID=A0AAV4SMW6_CAEEX|nr:rho guanine nucleotide exchange factor 10 [Caerostris extrusa]